MESTIEVGRRERKRQALHQQLLECAEQLFVDRGVAGTTVDDIAEAADVARQTVFNHFPYKEALALELSALGVQVIAREARALAESGTPALQVLIQVSHWLLDEAIEQGEIATVAARELLHPDPERAERAAQHIPLIEVLETLVLRAREERATRCDIPVVTIAELLGRTIFAAIGRITMASTDEIREELAVCFDIVFNGIRERRL